MPKNDWAKRDRLSKLASVMYPHLADGETRAEMDRVSKIENKQSPTTRQPYSRESGVAKRSK
jgi:hypothetical protein